MNTFLIAAGVYLSTRIIAFIAGELTEAEIKKQAEIDAEIDKIIAECDNSALSDTEKEDAQKSVSVLERNSRIFEYLRNEAHDREENYSSLYDEIRESKKKVIDALKSRESIRTPLRKSSLELLVRQLSEAQERCYGYIQYLRIYSDRIKDYSRTGEPPVFRMQLPSQYPYVGKVIWINSNQLVERSIRYDIPELFSISITVSDKSDFEYPQNSPLPIMITENHKDNFVASLEKGAFKAYELSNPHLGVSATVKEIQNKYVLLNYQEHLELFLPRNNLINPNRFPPIHYL